ncbi:glycosyltransferase [bacterium]|nr:MAG: glycosyltransferase [bacterium]
MRVLAVTNMYPTPDNPSVGTFVEQQVKSLRDCGVEVEILHLDRVRGGTRAYRNAGALALHQAERMQADILHVMYGGIMAERVTSAVRHLPVVVSFCGSDLLGEPLSRLKPRLFASLGVQLSYLAARRAAGIIVKSERMRSALPRDLDEAKVRVIPNGIDLTRFKPLDRADCLSSLGWDPAHFHVLFPANNGNPVKRPALAQAAVDALRRNGMPAEMHRLQNVPHADVPLWLNASDAILLTSQHEGSPNIVKEALVCNRPVVSVDVGDVKERLEGIEGCYLSLPEAEDLASKLQAVLERRTPVSSRTRMEKVSLASVARELQLFYQELLALRWIARMDDRRIPHAI